MTLFDPAPAAPAAPEADPGPPPGAERVRMLVAYNGGGFRGFAAQPGMHTVAGSLVTAIERFVGHTVELACAGRTDAGVHAWGQVVHADLIAPRRRPAAGGNDEGRQSDGQHPTWTVAELHRLQRAVTKMLGPEVVVRAVDIAPEDFHARFSATGRRYRYTVLNRPVPDPFAAPTTWHVANPLDLRAMRLACDPLIGEHDFSSFCRRPPGPPEDHSLVRLLRAAEWLDLGDGRLRFDVEASSFCHQMVRALVGTMVDVGLGRRKAGDMAWILRARDRQRAGQLAPPHGLCLWEVGYPESMAFHDSDTSG